LLRRGIASWTIYTYQQVLFTRHQITDSSNNPQKDRGRGLYELLLTILLNQWARD
jgi:hypothetical protein